MIYVGIILFQLFFIFKINIMECKSIISELDHYPKIKLIKHPSVSDIYDSKKDLFDPSNSSPPNEFIMKLIKRMENFKKTQKA